MSDSPTHSRRQFLQGSAGTALGAAAAVQSFPAIVSGQNLNSVLRVGLVGCGGRGTGAASQAMKADDKVELAAMADVVQPAVDHSLEVLHENLPEPHTAKLKVATDHQFIGLDAYQKLIASDVDVVLLATPPGFRPVHLRAAVDAGKHIFCEKPVAVDAPGARSVLESAQLAADKHLSLVSGFCWRYSNYIRETMEKVRSGAIGNIVAYYATYYTSPVKPMLPESERDPSWSDLEWQVRNWYNFNWLSGDGLVEQAVHSVDKVMWAMGDKPPVSCVAVGGRQIPSPGGNIYDHFEVNYEWENGIRAFLGCRQIDNCYNENADYILGAKGALTIGRGTLPTITGENPWRYRGDKNDMYQQEHDELFASIRRSKPINNGVWMTSSTMAAIMGRMAAYTGQKVTWEQAMNSQDDLGPDHPTWDMSLPVRPVALPGRTELL